MTKQKTSITPEEWDSLEEIALSSMKNAYAPYSNFKVGAALLTDDEAIIPGCNVESASYGLCLCAERNALTTAVAEGHRDFKGLVVASTSDPPAPPCGMCLQFLAEFCVDLPIRLINPKGLTQNTSLLELITQPFRWKGAK